MIAKNLCVDKAYCPDFNPIEETFSKVKTVLKSTKEMSTIDDVEKILLLASFTQITFEDCDGWISQSGIYNNYLINTENHINQS